jgi:hypothetical protein
MRQACPQLAEAEMRASNADAVHQPAGRGSDAAKAEDSAEPAREHAVPRELIEPAKFEVFMLQDQALGRRQVPSQARAQPSTRHCRRRWLPLAHPPGARPAE